MILCRGGINEKIIKFIVFYLLLVFISIKTYADIYIPDEEVIEEEIIEKSNGNSESVLFSLIVVGIIVVVVITLAILLLKGKGKGKKAYG